MKFKGTPGPWSAHDDEESMATSVVMNDFGDILCVVGSYMTSVEEDYSNANLIAAAPDLLEALQLSVKAMQEGRLVSYPEWYGTINKARAAIAKAIGEED